MTLGPSELSMLRTILGMGVLTMAMSSWMSITRVAAMRAAGISLAEAAHTSELRPRLPSAVRRVGDNFNHLFEVPTLFYAVTLVIVVAGLADQLHAACAWTFLGSRVCHSLVQATFNSVPIRIVFYTSSWLALSAMIVRALLAI